MPKIAVYAKFVAQPGKGDELIAALQSLVAAAESEPGTEVYAVHRPKDQPDVVWFYERYADEAALAAHAGSEAMAETGGKLGALMGGPPEIVVSEVVAGTGAA